MAKAKGNQCDCREIYKFLALVKHIRTRFILALMESLAGSGHRFAYKRLRLAEKLDVYRFDPWVRQWVIYREIKKIRTLKD